jgi:HAE1 family hydrophobic/amphiphilic exporter-1
MWLVRLSINRPILITMVEIFLLVLGVIGFSKIGVDQFPKVDPPVITITTEYPGAGPREIETLVSKPIEEQVNQIGGIERLISTSRENVSRVVIEFKLEVDARMAQIEVQNKLAKIKSILPKETEEPLVQRLDFADRPIVRLVLGATPKTGDQAASPQATARAEFDAREIADKKLKQKLQQVDGVGDVAIYGGREREVIVEMDRQRLLLWKLTPSDVAQAIRNTNLNTPAGALKEEPRERSIRVIGEYARTADIESTVVKGLPGGKNLTIKDIAKVYDTFRDKTSSVRYNGRSVVLIEVKRQSDANTVAVSDRVKERIEEIRSSLSSGADLEIVYDGSRVIRAALFDVIESLIVAAILAFVVVYFFLGSIQSTLITGIALPCTIVVTFFALYIFGFTLNIMTLLGITLAVGLILDDAIVVRENIWSKIEEGLPPRQASEEGTKQVYQAVLATSLTVLATFIPVAFIPGIVGRFFAAFALTVCIGIIVSTFDALTMAPMLSAHMKQSSHKGVPNIALRAFEKGWQAFEHRYKVILTWSLQHPKWILIGAAAIFVSSLILPKFIGFTFLPANENGEMQIVYDAPPGTALALTDKITRDIEAKLTELPEIAFTVAQIGNEFSDTNVGNVYIRLVPRKDRSLSSSDMKTKLRAELQAIQRLYGLNLTVQDSDGGTGQRQITMAIQGRDTDELLRLGETVLSRARTEVPEAVNLTSNMKPGKSELQFAVDHARAAEFGLTTDDVGRGLRGLFEGELAGKYRDKGEEYDIRVRLPLEERVGIAALQSLTIPNQRGEAVPLSALTRSSSGQSPTSIIRINQVRAALIEGDLAEGSPLGTVLKKLTALAVPLMPDGYSVEFQGQAKSLKDLGVGMMIAMGLGALFIYMIMASLYESIVIPFAILLTLPLAIVGAFVALLVSGRFMDVYTVIGIIMLMGLVTKNAILVVDYVEQLRSDGVERMKALLDAGVRRLRPIMMTSVAMIAGMVPIAMGLSELNKGRAGMGIACIGGLISSTILSLVVIPCAYIYLDNLRIWWARR